MEKDIPVPIACSQLEDVSAKFVENLVKYTLQLHWSYTSESKPIVFRIKTPLNITWCKMLRPPTFIVVSSNLEESRISVWKLGEHLDLCAEYYVSGPVVNGQIFDTGNMVVIGLTIGSMYVQCN